MITHFQLRKNQKQLTKFMNLCHQQVFLYKLLQTHQLNQITLADPLAIIKYIKSIRKTMRELCLISDIDLPLSYKTFPISA